MEEKNKVEENISPKSINKNNTDENNTKKVEESHSTKPVKNAVDIFFSKKSEEKNTTEPSKRPKKTIKSIFNLEKKYKEKKKKEKKKFFKEYKNDVFKIPTSSIRKLARRGGVKRIKRDAYDEIRINAKLYLEKIIKDAVIYTTYSKRKTVNVGDITQSLKKNKINVYGYDFLVKTKKNKNVKHEETKKIDN